MNLSKKLTAALACVVGIASSSFAQDFPGYNTGNYNGVNGVFFNPANVVDSRFRFDVNLFAFSANVGNNNARYKVKEIGDLFKNDSVFVSRLFPENGKPTNGLVNIVLNMPSFMFNINEKNSVAVTTRYRTLANVNDVDATLVNTIRNNESIDLSKAYNLQANNNQRINLNGWAEVGLTYGHVFVDKGKHFIKAGITGRYLAGMGNAHLQLDKIQGAIVDNNDGKGAYISSASGAARVGTSGINITNDISFNDIDPNGRGVGGDIGLVYEFRPDFESYKNKDASWKREENKYKLKVGLSLLDFGRIRFDGKPDNASYAMHIPAGTKFYLNEFDGKNISEISDVFENHREYFTKNAGSSSYKASLPTTVQLNVDYKVVKHFYVSAMGILSTVKNNDKIYNSRYYNTVALTPRYESRIFDFYLPLSYNQLTKFNAGAGFRVGPVFAGTGSGLTALLDKSKQADVYFGLHIGIQHKAKKIKALPEEPPVVAKPVDTDGDGIEDKADKCPAVAGKAKYNGCPVPDTDGDGINDEEDACPAVAGVAKYKGCPVPDTDGDGIKDDIDACPTVAGVAAYKGCPVPDTDGDGINDEADKCPTVAGIAANFGCPEIKKDVVAKVEKAAKSIYFQTGKAVLLNKSFAQMNQVAALLKADPTLNIEIKGHTDNVGKPESNQKLCQQRADAVKAYLVKKGIAADRVSANGFGDSQPVAPNTTAAGRQQNRRVELTMRNY